MAEHSKKLYISKGGNLEAIPLYTDLTEVGTPALRLQDGNDTVFAKLGTGARGATSLKCLHQGTQYNVLRGNPDTNARTLFHFDDTPIKDEAGGLTWTQQDITLSDNSKFGNHSLSGGTLTSSKMKNPDCWIEMFVYLPYTSGDVRFFSGMDWFEDGSYYHHLVLESYQSNIILRCRRANQGVAPGQVAVPVTTNQWHHVVVGRSSKSTAAGYPRYVFYVDGLKKGVLSSSYDDSYDLWSNFAYYRLTPSSGILIDEFREFPSRVDELETIPVPTIPYV